MSSKTLVAFATDDDEGELELLRRALDELSTIEIELRAYTDPNLALIEFLNHDADLIFLDYQLGEMTAIDVLEQMRRIGDLRPAIVLTGHGDEYAAAELTRAGADDYIVKNDLNAHKLKDAIARSLAAYGKRLSEAEVVKHAFELERANAQLKVAKRDLERMNARLQDLSDTDPLTGISNRRSLVNRGEKELSRAVRNGDPVSIALVDIDGFDLVQDRHGKRVCDFLDHIFPALRHVPQDMPKQDKRGSVIRMMQKCLNHNFHNELMVIIKKNSHKTLTGGYKNCLTHSPSPLQQV